MTSLRPFIVSRITSSHFNLLGSNTYRWPLELDALPNNGWDWDEHPQLMAHLWRASIDALKDYEVLWSVGLRGVTDAEYTYGCFALFRGRTFRPV